MDWEKRLRERKDRKTLQSAIESSNTSDQVLHYFATDCAERALLRASQDRTIDKEVWDLLKTKRLWLEGKIATELLEAATKKSWARHYILNVQRAVRAAFWSADHDALEAAMNASHRAQWSACAEADWQCRRLAFWIRLSKTTDRLWLAYEDNCPIEGPSLTEGFENE